MASFAKIPSQPPQFDATAFVAKLNQLASKLGFSSVPADFVSWKRWVGGELEYDGIGLRDIVAADAAGLNALKADYDAFHTLTSGQVVQLFERVTALENAPSVPFPASGPPSAGP